MSASAVRARARSLKRRYERLRERDPTRAAQTAADLRALARSDGDPEVAALAAWTAGLAALQLEGEASRAIELLDDAVDGYAVLGRPDDAARIQVGRIHALAMLGRYADALSAADQARVALTASGDSLALAKVEQNVGNIRFRLHEYRAAEAAYRRARDAYLAIGDPQQLVQIDTCLAAALKWQHEFREAGRLYEDALELARQNGLGILEAELACNLGCLELDQGRFDAALAHLEHSRRRFVELGLVQNATQVEFDLANAYLELNLAPEAADLAARVADAYAARGLRAECARALVCRAQALLRKGELDAAAEPLTAADALFAAEGNAVGQRVVRVLDAERARGQGDYALAAERARSTIDPFDAAGDSGRVLLARWIVGDSLRALGQPEPARAELTAVLEQARMDGLPRFILRGLTSLGVLERAEGNASLARDAFLSAVELAEQMRAPLPAEEFRSAFFADKLTPYFELTRLALDDGDDESAFGYVESARSRALSDTLAAGRVRARPGDAFEIALATHLDELREELSWYYSRATEPAPPDEMRALYAAVAEREAAAREIQRQLAQHGAPAGQVAARTSLRDVRIALGAHSALVEYTSLDDELLAFVVTDEGLRTVRRLGSERHVASVVNQLRLQMDTLRIGQALPQSLLAQLEQRARAHLSTLYDLVLRPIMEVVGDRRLVASPHRALHYVPFQALFDGDSYVVEQREVVVVPSARVLAHCLSRPARPITSALLIGVADERTPRVHDEVNTLASILPSSRILLDDAATLEALRMDSAGADVVHLACHAQFRPDNPLFSALRLGTAWLMVRDLYDLPLEGALVTLSACETGVSAVAPGDEVTGLARGLFAAGARALVVSLWTVDDTATAELMADYYTRLTVGDGPAAALRHAQRTQLKRRAHPYYWSAFSVFGRW